MASPAGSAPRQGPRWWYMSPLALTLLPLLYSAPALKSRPQLRTGVVGGLLVAGLVHGFALMSSAGGEPAQEETFMRAPPTQQQRAPARVQ